MIIIMIEFKATCPICLKYLTFIAPDDYWSCWDSLYSPHCPFNGCVTRERALAHVLFSKVPRKKICEELIIYECSPV